MEVCMKVCKICNNKNNNKVIKVCEMLRGTREQFDYLECSQCGCLQLIEIPSDMSAYYDNSSYGSFVASSRSYIKKIIRNMRNKHLILGQGGVLGFLISRFAPLPIDYSIIKNYANINSKILDVGCGGGAYLKDLSEMGFSNVSGIDPYIQNDITYDNGVTVSKKSLEDLSEKYDVILSHHSFEHVPEPEHALKNISNALNYGGVCLLTMPVAEDLYRLYQENCYLIQAPQHYFLYSIRGFLMLAEKCGMKVENVLRDATTTRNWYLYSEMWSKNIAGCEFSQAEFDQYLDHSKLSDLNKIEKRLNQVGLGDNVTFVLRKGENGLSL